MGISIDRRYTREALWEMEGGDTRSNILRGLMSRSLIHVPTNVADRVLEGCCLLVEEPGNASYIPREQVKERAIISFSIEALKGWFDDPDMAIDTFLHEAAHFLLGHRDAMHLVLEEYD